MSDGKVVIDTRLDTKGAEKGLRGLETSLSKIGKLVAVAFSAKVLMDFGKKAVSLASDLQEVQNVVDTAFGDMTYKMEEFADTAIETYGISKLVAKQTGSTYMAMARGMGLAVDNASDMALSLTGLSADMASFYNVSQDVARTALNSIFTGETETLKKFGVVMTEANLNAFALSQGITKSYQSMSQAEKVQLRYNFVMQQTALAHGDFAKTSSSWSNQIRILSERWKELLTIMGNGLLNVFTPLVKMLNNLLATLINVANVISKAFGGSEIKSTQAVANNISDIALATEDATDATNALAKAQHGLSGQDELNVISSGSSAGGGAGGIDGAGMSQIATEVSETVDNASPLLGIFSQLQDISIDNLASSFERLKDACAELVGNIGDGLKWLWDNALLPMTEWTVEDALPAFINLLASSIELLNAVIESAKPTLTFLWENFLEPITSFAGDVFVATLQDFADILSAIAGNEIAIEVITSFLLAFGSIKGLEKANALLTTFKDSMAEVSTLRKVGIVITVAVVGWEIGQNIYEMITGEDASEYGSFTEQMSYIGEWIGEELPSLFKKFGDGLKEDWNTIAGFFKGIWKGITDGFVGAINGIKADWSTITLFFSNIINGIKTTFSTIGSWFYNIFSGAVNNIKSVFSWGAISSTVTGIFNGIKTVFNNIPNFFKTTFTNAWQNVKNVFGSAGTVFNNLKDGIVNAFKGIVNGLIDGINAAISIPFNTINSALNKIRNISIVGAKPFKGLPTVSVPKIPKLATGAVIPPNKEFLAMLGDQKHGTNIEAPLDTLIEAYKKAQTDVNTQVIIKVEGDPQKIFKFTQEQAQNYNMRTGRPAFA